MRLAVLALVGVAASASIASADVVLASDLLSSDHFQAPVAAPATETADVVGLADLNGLEFSFDANAPVVTSGTSSGTNLVPAPGAVALLGLGGLVAGRRRR